MHPGLNPIIVSAFNKSNIVFNIYAHSEEYSNE